MKKIYFLPFLLLGIACSAQLVSTNFAIPGSSFEFRVVDDQVALTSVLPVIAGSSSENMTWDLTGLVPIEEQPYSAEILVPSEGPSFDQMTDANYLIREVFTTGTIRNSYYNLTSTEFSRVGSFDEGTSLTNIYFDPQTELVFPLDFGTINEDQWQSSTTFFSLPYNIECIGTGTLLLPDGIVYENLYLIEVLIGGIPAQQVYYFHDGLGVPRATFFPGNFFTEAPLAFQYMSAEVLSDMGSEKRDLDISYNNPVDSDLRIVFNAEMIDKLQYLVYDISGKTVLSGQYAAYSNILDIEMDNLNSGIYLVNLIADDGKSMTLKIVKD